MIWINIRQNLISDYCFNLYSNDTYCSELAAAGKCTDDLLFMTKQCPAACGICDLVCHDALDSIICQTWAPMGGCKKNPKFMLSNCGKTCEGCESGRKKKTFLKNNKLYQSAARNDWLQFV